MTAPVAFSTAFQCWAASLGMDDATCWVRHGQPPEFAAWVASQAIDYRAELGAADDGSPVEASDGFDAWIKRRWL